MDGLREIQAKNDAAASRELGELRRDTVRGLKYALENEGEAGVINILREAAVLTPVFDWFADGNRKQEEA